MADEQRRPAAPAPDGAAQQTSRALADAQAEAETHPRDETVEGGRYITDSGDLVDADGQPLQAGKE